LFDGHDLADPVGRIDDEFVGLEALALCGLLAGHSGYYSLLWLATAERFGHGSRPARTCPGGVRCPPVHAGRGLFGPPAHAGRTLLGLVTHLPCNSLCVLFARPFAGLYRLSSPKNKAPEGGAIGINASSSLYSTFSAKIKALRHRKTADPGVRRRCLIKLG